MHAPATKFPDFELLEKLGEGGMSWVYLAQQKHPNRRVALKIVPPQPGISDEFFEQLRCEADIAAKFQHENLVNVYGCGVVDDHYYMAMEYLPGGDLQARLAQPIAVEDAMRITAQVAAGLSCLHARSYVHRDVKPANILFRDNGRAVLVDFAIAKPFFELGNMTRAGMRSGTPGYMSPEQVQRRGLDGRSDLYSLGVVLYQMLAGELPCAVMEAGHVTVPKLPRRARAFQSIADRLLAPGPDDRFQSAEQLLKALVELSRSVPYMQTPVLQSNVLEVATPTVARRPWRPTIWQGRMLSVLVLYSAAAWLLAHVIDASIYRYQLPPWLWPAALAALLLGLPVTLLLFWWSSRRNAHTANWTTITLLVLGTLAVLTSLGPMTLRQAPGPPRGVASAPASGFAPPANSLAILPLRLLSADGDVKWQAAGIIESLWHNLVRYKSLRVTSMRSTSVFDAKDRSLDDIARRLNVALIVDGSIQRVADQVRLLLSLYDAKERRFVWSNHFDFAASDLLAGEDATARETLVQVQLRLAIGNSPVLQQRGTRNLVAYTLYLKGSNHLKKFESPAARKLFEQALTHDPGFVRPYAALVQTYDQMLVRGLISTDEYLASARPLVQKALQLDSQLPEVRLAVASLRAAQNDIEGEVDALKQTIETAPSYAPAYLWLGAVRWRQGRRREAAGLFKVAYEIDPMHQNAVAFHATSLFNFGDRQQGMHLLEQTWRVNPSSSILSSLQAHLLGYGEVAQALHWTRVGMQQHLVGQRNYPFAALAYTRLGQFQRAEAWLTAADVRPYSTRIVAGARAYGRLCQDKQVNVESLAAKTERPLGSTVLLTLQSKHSGRFALRLSNYILSKHRRYYGGGELLSVTAYLMHYFRSHGQDAKLQRVSTFGRDMLARFVRMGLHGYPPATYSFAQVSAELGDTQGALRWLQTAVNEGWNDSCLLNHDPTMNALRQRPAFSRVRQRVNASLQAQRKLLGRNLPMPISKKPGD